MLSELEREAGGENLKERKIKADVNIVNIVNIALLTFTIHQK